MFYTELEKVKILEVTGTCIETRNKWIFKNTRVQTTKCSM